MLLLFWNGVAQVPATPFAATGKPRITELYEPKLSEVYAIRVVELYQPRLGER